MIESIEIRNFKAHKKADITFGNLCILTGINGMGKSSIIQSLLLLRQSFLTQREFLGLLLGGDLTNIGNSQDAFCDYSSESTLSFKIKSNFKEWQLNFQRFNDKNFLPISEASKLVDFGKLNLFGNNFQYIAAEHTASKESHSRNTFYVEQLNQISEKLGACRTYFLLRNLKNRPGIFFSDIIR